MGDRGELGDRDGSDGRRRVAILGGGAAGVTAAYELSKTRELREAFEVTVYQQGWRLGGKGASGRTSATGPRGPHRIEEHGLHVWFGFYRNAFRMMRECFEAGHPEVPFARIDQAFTPIDRLVLNETDDAGEYVRDPALTRCLAPPDDVRLLEDAPTFVQLLQRIVELLEMYRFGRDVGDLAASEASGELAGFDAAVADADDIAVRQAKLSAGDPKLYADFADQLGRAAQSTADMTELRAARRLRIWAALAELAIRVIGEKVLDHQDDPAPFDHLNEFELRDVLRSFTSDEELLYSAPVRSLYDLAFSYERGDPAKPDVAAGVAIENVISILLRHDGVMMRKMNGGMGDVVFAPLYLLLRDRGVRFEFFSSVTEIDAQRAGGGGARVRGVRIQPQALLKDDADAYDPLVRLDIPSWPAEPLATQLSDDCAKALAALERTPPGASPAGTHPHWALEREANPLGVSEKRAFVLQCNAPGASHYVDEVVLAIPVGAHRQLAPGLGEAHDGFREMVKQAEPVCTQSFQLWLPRSMKQLGWPCEGARHPLLGAYAKPFDTLLDMSHAIAAEGGSPELEPAALAFLCGVLPDPEGDAWGDADWPEAHQRARANVERFLDDHEARSEPPFWWNLTVAGDVGSLADHYWRANSTGWERYATSHGGAMNHRLRPDGTRPDDPGMKGFDNLALAGDWTYTPINAGAVEAAVMSGIEAAATVVRRSPRRVDLTEPTVIKASWRGDP